MIDLVVYYFFIGVGVLLVDATRFYHEFVSLPPLQMVLASFFGILTWPLNLIKNIELNSLIFEVNNCDKNTHIKMEDTIIICEACGKAEFILIFDFFDLKKGRETVRKFTTEHSTCEISQ